MSSPDRNRNLTLTIAAVVTFGATGLMVMGLATAPGCKAAPCTTSEPNEPSSALECPAGQLCYLGECVRSCSAGQERVQECDNDSACGGALPKCIDGFCSACEGFETCVPELNLCQNVPEVEYPDPEEAPNMFQRPPYPLDGGFEELDGSTYVFPGIKRLRDGGVTGPIEDPEVTVAGFWDVYEQDNLRTGVAVHTSSTSLRVYDVRGVGNGISWRSDLNPPRIADPIDQDAVIESCIVRSYTSTTTVQGRRDRDIGDIRLTDLDDYDGMRDDLIAQFDDDLGRYVVTRDLNLPGRLLNASQLGETITQQFVTLTSPGSDLTDGSWPVWEGNFRGFHVPFELTPTNNTVPLMNARIDVTQPATADLTFTWTYVSTGNDNFERVIVRITGNRTELFCTDTEGSQGNAVIAVRTGALDEFIRREGGPGEYDLVFERASAQSPLVVAVEGELIQFSLRLRQSLVQRIRFQ